MLHMKFGGFRDNGRQTNDGRTPVHGYTISQEQIISLTGLSALSIVLWKPNVIVSPLALDFEREEKRKVISM